MGAIISFGILFGLMILILGFAVASYVDNRKNPHLGYNVLSYLSNGEKEEDPRVIKINENLELRLSFDFLLVLKVYVKNRNGKFILVEQKSYGIRPPNGPIKFQEPWHQEISDCLRKMYDEELKEETLVEKEKQEEIKDIKNNWGR